MSLLQKNGKRIIGTFLVILAAFSCIPTLMLFLTQEKKKIEKTDLKITKLPYQTNAYYEAYEKGIDLSIKNINLETNKSDITIFNVSPFHFIFAVDGRMAFIDTNAFIETLNKPINTVNTSGFLWWLIKLMDISRIMYIRMKIKKSDVILLVDGCNMSIDNFKLAAKYMITCQMKSEKKEDNTVKDNEKNESGDIKAAG